MGPCVSWILREMLGKCGEKLVLIAEVARVMLVGCSDGPGILGTAEPQ